MVLFQLPHHSLPRAHKGATLLNVPRRPTYPAPETAFLTFDPSSVSQSLFENVDADGDCLHLPTTRHPRTLALTQLLPTPPSSLLLRWKKLRASLTHSDPQYCSGPQPFSPPISLSLTPVSAVWTRICQPDPVSEGRVAPAAGVLSAHGLRLSAPPD